MNRIENRAELVQGGCGKALAQIAESAGYRASATGWRGHSCLRMDSQTGMSVLPWVGLAAAALSQERGQSAATGPEKENSEAEAARIKELGNEIKL